MTNRQGIMRALLWYLCAALAVALDQISKYAATQFLQGKPSVVVIDGALSLTYATNRGAAFSMLSDHRWVFLSLSAIAIVAILAVIWIFRRSHALFGVALGMILGGGVGNMIDRVAQGEVVDFIHVTFIDFPVFNVADCFITIGCVFALFYFIFFDHKQAKPVLFEPKNVTDDVSMATSNNGQNVHQNDVPNDVPLDKNTHATIPVKTDTETEKTIETQSAHSSHRGSNTHIDLAEQDGVDHSVNSVKKADTQPEKNTPPERDDCCGKVHGTDENESDGVHR